MDQEVDVEVAASVDQPPKRKRARLPASITRRTKKRRAQRVKARDSLASPQLGMYKLIIGLY